MMNIGKYKHAIQVACEDRITEPVTTFSNSYARVFTFKDNVYLTLTYSEHVIKWNKLIQRGATCSFVKFWRFISYNNSIYVYRLCM